MQRIAATLKDQIHQYEKVHGRQAEARRFADAMLKGGILMSYLRGETDEKGNPLPKKRKGRPDSVKRKQKRQKSTKVADRRSNKGKIYNVHIDHEDAWDELVREKEKALKKLLKVDQIQEIIEKITKLTFVQKTALHQMAKRWTEAILWKQIERIAKILKVSALVIFALQLMYELNTMCTSVVLRTKDGTIAHGRTMDWDMKELEAISVPVRVYVDNKPLGYSMHWVGCVGMFTVMRSQAPEGPTRTVMRLTNIIGKLGNSPMVEKVLQMAKKHEREMSRSNRKLHLGKPPLNGTTIKKLEHIIRSLTLKEVREVVTIAKSRIDGTSTSKAPVGKHGYSISINYRAQRGDANAFKKAKTIVENYFNNSLTSSMVLTLNQFLGFGDAGMYDTIHEYVGDIGIILFSRWIQGSQAASFILRDVLTTCKTYDQALDKLKTTPVFTQVYFTIAGTDGGAVIARSKDKVDRIKELTSTTHYLIQPNMDWWGEAPTSWIPGRETNLWRRSLRVGT